VSPGSAPATSTGPVIWSTWSKTSVASDSAVELAVIWPFEASRQSNSTISPDPTLATGAIAGSQARWLWSREMPMDGVSLPLIVDLLLPNRATPARMERRGGPGVG
jgi:hypothetical protein